MKSALRTHASPDDETASKLKAELEELASEWLSDYTERLATGAIRVAAKVVNDAVWGSIRLNKWEVAILDSYLMQRLRGLRQLGVIHWVYPNAGHSRFEHSLGVMHQTSRIVEGLERNSGRAGERLVHDVTAKLLRIAGLVHDTGHSVMSHVSESFMERQPGIAELRTWLQDMYRPRKKPSASEAIAAVLVRSPAFRQLLRTPQIGADFVRDVDDAVDKIAGLLLGAPVFPEQAFLTLVINGAFDADKLDYMPRDALMCGVPSAVDVSRLVEKVHCVRIPAGESKKPLKDYRKWAGVDEDRPVQVLALPRSAATTLEELAVARTVLYEKVYFHQKVRALEAMVRRVLEKETLTTIEWLQLSDEQLLSKSGVAESLRTRRLLKRAFYLSNKAKTESDSETSDASSDTADEGWRRLRKDFKEASINGRINLAAKEAAEHLGMDQTQLDDVPAVLDLPRNSKLELDQFAYIGDSFSDLQLAPAALTGARSETAKHIARQQGYVYADERTVLPVYFAARKVMREDYAQEVGKESYAKTKLDPSDLAAAHSKLFEAGFLADKPDYVGAQSRHARLLDEFLDTAWPRIEELATRFGQFQPVGRGPISESTIASYLRQFESEDHARVALRMLEKVQVKDRHFFAKSIERSIREALKLGEISHVCPFGATGDSSATLAYYMSDLPAELRRPVAPFELALEQLDKGGILLWDDFCGAAGHSITALAQWLGETRKLSRYLLDEHLAEELSAERKRAVRKRPLRIAFAMARNAGLATLRAALNEVKLSNATVLDPVEEVRDDRGLFSPSADVFLTSEEGSRFEAYCKERSRNVLQHKVRTSDWANEKLEQRLLGYGNTAQLFVFYYNVPTVTMTLLWQASEDWVPLFPRREKASALGAKHKNTSA